MSGHVSVPVWGVHVQPSDISPAAATITVDVQLTNHDATPATARVTAKLSTTLARPFLPAKAFAISKRFYVTLGFQKLLDGEVAIFGIGATSFILQNYYQEQWAGNFMMQLMVDDLDAWWKHIESFQLATTFGVDEPKPPAMQPWGVRIAYLFDPSGVLWHVAQRPEEIK